MFGILSVLVKQWPVTCDLWPVTCKRNLPFVLCWGTIFTACMMSIAVSHYWFVSFSWSVGLFVSHPSLEGNERRKRFCAWWLGICGKLATGIIGDFKLMSCGHVGGPKQRNKFLCKRFLLFYWINVSVGQVTENTIKSELGLKWKSNR